MNNLLCFATDPTSSSNIVPLADIHTDLHRFFKHNEEKNIIVADLSDMDTRKDFIATIRQCTASEDLYNLLGMSFSVTWLYDVQFLYLVPEIHAYYNYDLLHGVNSRNYTAWKARTPRLHAHRQFNPELPI